MSDCDQSCDGCPSKAEHHLCDACCHDEVDAIQRENRELQEKLEAVQAELEKVTYQRDWYLSELKECKP